MNINFNKGVVQVVACLSVVALGYLAFESFRVSSPSCPTPVITVSPQVDKTFEGQGG